MPKVEATIYLANQRGCSVSSWFRSYYTFNFGDFKRENGTPFGSLVAFNEHTLKECASLSFSNAESLKVLLIPVVGELHYRSDNIEGIADVGQASWFVLPAATPLRISNEYRSSSIHFLQVYLSGGNDETYESQQWTCNFSLADNHIQQLELPGVAKELFSIGKLIGRQDVVYRQKVQHSAIFIYQIGGTCEVQGRLLLPGDALSLTNVETIEFEALTPEAIVFVAELPLPQY